MRHTSVATEWLKQSLRRAQPQPGNAGRLGIVPSYPLICAPTVRRLRHPNRVKKIVVRPKHALLISFHAYPALAIGAKRLSSLANHLANRGWRVTIVAASARPTPGAPLLDPRVRDFRIPVPKPVSERLGRVLHPLRQTRSNRTHGTTATAGLASPKRTPSRLRREFNRVVGVVDNHKLWSWHLSRALHALTRTDRPDAIVVSGPPFSTVAASAFCARKHAIPLVVDFRDPWQLPDTDHADLYDGLRRHVDSKLEAWCVQTASHITVTSRSLAALLTDRYDRHGKHFSVIRNGFEAEQRIFTPPPRGSLEMLYAGTVYLNRNPFPLLEALDTLVRDSRVDRHRVRMTFVGDCDSWKDRSVSKWVEARGLQDVVCIKGMMPPDEVIRLTEKCNVVVTLAQQQRLSVPGKIFEQIASFRKLLIFTEQDSETADAVRDLDRAVVVAEDDVQSAFRSVLALYEEMTNISICSMPSATEIEPYSRARTNADLERVLCEALR